MIIQSKNVWIDEAFRPAQIEIEAGKIKKVKGYGEEAGAEDYGDLRILPGLIDIHCHGYGGMDCNYVTKEGMANWQKALVAEGVTGFMATTSTAPFENLIASQGIIADLIENQNEGAVILGTHVEGPLINHDYKGAHNPYYIAKPTIELFEKYQEAARGHIKMVCIATERDNDFALTKYCAERGIKVVIGHTAAKYEDCLAAAEAGAVSFTHTFNAMVGIHHRNPGTAGAALSMDNMYAELICDGVHVHFAVARTVVRAKGKDKLILITDSSTVKGMPVGRHEKNGSWVEIGEDGAVRLPNGTLTGSTNKLIRMLKNCITIVEAPLATAINAATINPARFLDLADRKGLIKEGYDADIIVIDDDYAVKQTYIAGAKKLV